jgi:biopolymer transport protein TolR
MQGQFEREELQAPLSEINMTPLVDVILVLLVIFLITAPMLNSVIQLNLPQETGKQINEEKPVTISINRTGEYFLDDKKISIQQLELSLMTVVQKNPKQQIHLRADIEVEYGKVSKILGISQRLGLTNIGFVTESK